MDETAYEGREQARVKHALLEKYLPQWAYRVGREWDKLVYIDGFAGPWQVCGPDCADSSFAVAVNSLKKAQEGLRGFHGHAVHFQSVLVGLTEAKREQLDTWATTRRDAAFDIDTVAGEFAEQIPSVAAAIARDRRKSFRFAFLDPKGWKEIPMQQLAPFLNARGCEVVINLMTRHIYRFLEQADRADSYRRLFGREGVLEKIQRYPKPQRTEQVVLEYGASLKQLCGFKYVSAAVVLRPDKEEVLYYLVFATNHPKGVEVFKDAEMKAADIQNEVRIQAQARRDNAFELPLDGDGQKTQLVQELRERFCHLARERVLRTLIQEPVGSRIPYADLFCEAMAFPLVTPADLHSWIASAAEGLALTLGGHRRRTPSPDEEHGDYVTVTDAARLRTAFGSYGG